MSAASALRTAGLIGGMSWESSQHYYRLLNQGVRDQIGPSASAPLVMQSFNFASIEGLQNAGDWRALDGIMSKSAQTLESAGADFILICSNSMHMCASAIANQVDIPLLHIADAVGRKAQILGYSCLGLIGTRFTMEGDFLRQQLSEVHNLKVIVPGLPSRRIVHDIIYRELIAGIVDERSRMAMLDVIRGLHREGADAVVLGCTEIMLLVSPSDTEVPLIDTTSEHASAAVAEILGNVGDITKRR